MQSQKVISAYFTSEKILPFGFAEQNNSRDGLVVVDPGIVLDSVIIVVAVVDKRSAICDQTYDTQIRYSGQIM